MVTLTAALDFHLFADLARAFPLCHDIYTFQFMFTAWSH